MDMTVGVTMDCEDVARVAVFWRNAIGYEEPHAVDDSSPFHVLVSPGDGLHHITLQRVPEPKITKNRVHLDLFVPDLDAEVERLVPLGATIVAAHDAHGGFRSSILADPEGNEFCVVERV